MSNPKGRLTRIPGSRPLAPSLIVDEPAALGPRRTSGLAIASLVLGCLSLPGMLMSIYGPAVALIGLVLGVFGIAKAEQRNLKRRIGQVGIALSALGLVGGILMTTAEVHAVNACRGVDVHDVKAYDDCVTHNLKL